MNDAAAGRRGYCRRRDGLASRRSTGLRTAGQGLPNDVLQVAAQDALTCATECRSGAGQPLSRLSTFAWA
jgi:hypothetical protein